MNLTDCLILFVRPDGSILDEAESFAHTEELRYRMYPAWVESNYFGEADDLA